MNILVAGGTGFIGQYLCAELDDRGHHVTALARSPDDATLPSTVETVRGDVTSYPSIEGAFDGQDAVINLVALPPMYKPPGNVTHEDVHLRGTEHCIRAAEEHDVSRFVQMSALDADPDGPTAYLRAKGKAERLVQDTDLNWTIIRPSIVFGAGSGFIEFTKKLKRIFAPGVPFYPLPSGGKTRFQPVYVEDLVSPIADITEGENHTMETYEFAGPEILTLKDVVHLVFRAEGKRIFIVPLPLPVAKLGLTVMGPVPVIPFGPDQARALKIDNTVRNNDMSVFGVDPTELTTLADYLGLAE